MTFTKGWTKCSATSAATILLLLASTVTALAADETADYGVDASFPIHHNFLGHNHQVERTQAVFGEDRIRTYYDYTVGCIEKYAETNMGHLCSQNEDTRLRYNRVQPGGVRNHTEVGFKVVTLSAEVWRALQEFWTNAMIEHDEKTKKNEDAGHRVVVFPDGLSDENWPTGNTYVNHWYRPTHITTINVDRNLTQLIWDESQKHMQEWIPRAELFTRSDIYGIRIYRNGHILAPHVDRDPLVSSAIINVDQDGMEEPWPLEVYDHAGKAHNVTIQPGEMILYESHSVIHGRPFPLRGNYYANIFVHFKPHFEGYEEYMGDREGFYAEGEICVGDRPLPARDDGRAVYTKMLACCAGEFAGQTSGKCLDEVIGMDNESEGEL